MQLGAHPAEYKPTDDLSFSVCSHRVDCGLMKLSGTHGSPCTSIARRCTRAVARHDDCSCIIRSAGVLHAARTAA